MICDFVCSFETLKHPPNIQTKENGIGSIFEKSLVQNHIVLRIILLLIRAADVYELLFKFLQKNDNVMLKTLKPNKKPI